MKNLSNLVVDFIGDHVNIYIETEKGLIQQPKPYTGETAMTLQQIYEYYPTEIGMLYVFCDRGLSGNIYRCGNYGAGIWQEYAVTKGYA